MMKKWPRALGAARSNASDEMKSRSKKYNVKILKHIARKRDEKAQIVNFFAKLLIRACQGGFFTYS